MCETSTDGTFIGCPSRIRQVLVNLLSNAVKFTEKGSITVHAAMIESDLQTLPSTGTATGTEGTEMIYRFPATGHIVRVQNNNPSIAEREQLAMETEPRLLRITVTDTGMGMKPEDMGRLFKPFSQLENAANKRFKGTGIGLVISRKLARMMGGDLTVTSAMACGSSFTFTVKVHALATRGASSLPTAPSPKRAIGSTLQVDPTTGAITNTAGVVVVHADPVVMAAVAEARSRSRMGFSPAPQTAPTYPQTLQQRNPMYGNPPVVSNSDNGADDGGSMIINRSQRRRWSNSESPAIIQVPVAGGRRAPSILPRLNSNTSAATSTNVANTSVTHSNKDGNISSNGHLFSPHGIDDHNSDVSPGGYTQSGNNHNVAMSNNSIIMIDGRQSLSTVTGLISAIPLSIQSTTSDTVSNPRSFFLRGTSESILATSTAVASAQTTPNNAAVDGTLSITTTIAGLAGLRHHSRSSSHIEAAPANAGGTTISASPIPPSSSLSSISQHHNPSMAFASIDGTIRTDSLMPNPVNDPSPSPTAVTARASTVTTPSNGGHALSGFGPLTTSPSPQNTTIITTNNMIQHNNSSSSHPINSMSSTGMSARIDRRLNGRRGLVWPASPSANSDSDNEGTEGFHLPAIITTGIPGTISSNSLASNTPHNIQHHSPSQAWHNSRLLSNGNTAAGTMALTNNNESKYVITNNSSNIGGNGIASSPSVGSLNTYLATTPPAHHRVLVPVDEPSPTQLRINRSNGGAGGGGGGIPSLPTASASSTPRANHGGALSIIAPPTPMSTNGRNLTSISSYPGTTTTTASSSSTLPVPSSSMSAIRILVIDDSVINVKLAVRMLRQLNRHWIVDTAVNGQQGFASFQANRYDLVFMVSCSVVFHYQLEHSMCVCCFCNRIVKCQSWMALKQHD
jgi:hypothetical protein